MSRGVRVNLHCHSSHSDGSVSPDRIAAALAAAGVRYAALTDHDTTDGLAAFSESLEPHGIGSLPGVEITVEGAADAIHLLAYGFDPGNAELQQLLKANRARRFERQSVIRADLCRLGRWFVSLFRRTRPPVMEQALPGVAEVIRTVHRAGGTAFLAHPLTITPDFIELGRWLRRLKALGLDGVEAVYGGYSVEVRRRLAELAVRHGLLVCAGSDFHGFDRPGLNQVAIDMPVEFWNAFGEAHQLTPVLAGAGENARDQAPPNGGMARRQLMPPSRSEVQRRRFALRIVLPTLLATALFIVTIFAIILPVLGNSLLQRKQELIRELTNSAWSILAGYEEDARSGLITRDEAQARAIDRIKQLHYGAEQKDYFWITDMQPRMIMHPYRPDLNGTDLSDFQDVRGTRLFVEFVNVARAEGEGYVDYYWQWKDNPDRLVPKTSFVKRFEPWDWVIGTGIYLDDVHHEIGLLTGRLTWLCLGISAVIVLLLAFITRESLRTESRRSRAEAELTESHEKYAKLVEATTEGTLMVLDGRCTYCNSKMAGMLGYTEDELLQLDFHAIFPDGGKEPDQTLVAITAVLDGWPAPTRLEGHLVSKDGDPVSVMLAVTRIAFGGKSGVILVARDIRRHRLLEEELGESREKYRTLTENIEIGVFRTTAGREPQFLEANPAARRILNIGDAGELTGKRLFDLVPDEDERLLLTRTLTAGAGLKNHILTLPDCGQGQSILSISLALVLDEAGKPRCYDGIVEDITRRQHSEEERDTLLQEFQSSLLFLNEPLRNVVQELTRCDMQTPVNRAIRLMSQHNCSALAITSGEDGAVIGIVTDFDLRERVLVAGGDPAQPVFGIMSSPVVSLPETAPVYEAILTMQQQQVGHLAIRSTAGRIISIVRHAELIQFHQYSSAVITSEIQRAQSVDEIVATRARLPRLVKTLLDTGARPRNINRIMTRLSDAIAERLIGLAMEELGPAPGRFCFMALGSEGRSEQTLVTDQDNALVYEDVAGEDAGQVKEYYERLSNLVCDWLNQAGYTYCPGEMMARNPKWRRSLSKWKLYFRDWITGATPHDLLQFNIFFDFRCVYGDRELTRELRAAIQSVMDDYPPFQLHFAQNALLYKPPIGFLGKLVVESGGENPNTINIKDAMLSIVNFARLYALRHQVEESNTLDRLAGLRQRHVLKRNFHEEVLQAYSFLMELRLNHQAQALVDGREPDNSIDPRQLNQMDEAMLKQAFALIGVIRKKIGFDFIGKAG